MTARRLVAGVAILGVALAIGLVPPAHFVVDGLSMAPGLMPGDVVSTGWLPVADRLRPPARFERWLVTAPDGTRAVKRVVGLPGEAVAIRDGDLVVDGTVAVKGPAVLAETAVPIDAAVAVRDSQATLPPDEVLDDVAFAREVNRSLETVRDAGLVAGLSTGTAAARLRATIDGAAIEWRLPAAADVRVVAGRLDGRLVAVAWRDRAAHAPPDRRSGLPSRVPEAWSFAATSPVDRATAARPECGIAVTGDARIDHAAGWRDVHLRPATDGNASWQVAAESYLVFGDFPTGSIDSRDWGPLRITAVRHRIRRP